MQNDSKKKKKSTQKKKSTNPPSNNPNLENQETVSTKVQTSNQIQQNSENNQNGNQKIKDTKTTEIDQQNVISASKTKQEIPDSQEQPKEQNSQKPSKPPSSKKKVTKSSSKVLLSEKKTTTNSNEQSQTLSQQNNENNQTQKQNVNEGKKIENDYQVTINKSPSKQGIISTQEQSQNQNAQKSSKPPAPKKTDSKSKTIISKNKEMDKMKSQEYLIIKESPEKTKMVQDHRRIQSFKENKKEQERTYISSNNVQNQEIQSIQERPQEQIPLQMQQNITSRLKIQDNRQNQSLALIPSNDSSLIQPSPAKKTNLLQTPKLREKQLSKFQENRQISGSSQNLVIDQNYRYSDKHSPLSPQNKTQKSKSSLHKTITRSKEKLQTDKSYTIPENLAYQSSIEKERPTSSTPQQNLQRQSSQNQQLQINQVQKHKKLQSESQMENTFQNEEEKSESISVNASISMTKTKVYEYMESPDKYSFKQPIKPKETGQYKIKNQHLLNNLSLANVQTISNLSNSSFKSQSQRLLKSQQHVRPQKKSIKFSEYSLKQSFNTNQLSSQNSNITLYHSNAISPEPDLGVTLKASMLASPIRKLSDLSENSINSMCSNFMSENNSMMTANETEFQNRLETKKQEQEKELEKLQQEGENYQNNIWNQIKKMNNYVDEIRSTLATENSNIIQNKILSESKCDNCMFMNNQLNELQERLWQLERFIKINDEQRSTAQNQNDEMMNLIDQVENIIMENHINQSSCRISCNII